MAERRMFTQKIVESDPFTEMPLSAQALYFHLNMEADDDGFVNAPNKIRRSIGAAEDDLKLLIAKRFILAFPNGTIVIKHWRMHNLLRKDRYKPTQYQEQLASLHLKSNGTYTEKKPFLPGETDLGCQETDNPATTRQPPDNQPAPQDRIGKDSIEEDRIEEGREEEPGQQIANLFNSLCPSFPSVKVLSDKRKSVLADTLKQYTVDDFKTLFEKAEATDFLKGKNERKWKASFDWLIVLDNMTKVLEGNYDDQKTTFQHEAEAAERMALKRQQQGKTIFDDDGLKERAEALKQQFANT